MTDNLGIEWQPCVKLPVTVHVREQVPGEAKRPALSDKEIDDLWDKEAEYYALYDEARGFARALMNLLK
jgi:hypothetical protein